MRTECIRFKFICALLIQLLLLGVTSFAQKDTNTLKTVEIFECYAARIYPEIDQTFDSASFSALNSLDAGDFLNQNSGTYIKDYGPGTTSTLSYRGNSASHTKIYWEGISVDNAQLGLSDLSLMNFSNFTTATFNPAGYSLEQGSGGFGGILNVSSSTESWDKFKLRSGLSFGSFNSLSVPIDFLISNKNRNLKFENSFNYLSSDNDYDYVDYLDKNEVRQRENAAYQRIQWMPSLHYKLKERLYFKLNYWLLDSDREVPSAIGTQHGLARQNDVWNRLKLTINTTSKSGKTYLNITSMMSEDYMLYTNESLNIDSRNTVRSFKNMLLTGYNISANWLAESHVRLDYQKTITNNYDSDKNQNLTSFFQSISYTRYRWFAKAMARLESFDNSNPVLLPALNIGYKPKAHSDQLWLFFNAAYNKRYPTFNERFWINSGNPDLENESSLSADISLDQNLVSFKKPNSSFDISYRVSLFYNQIDNMIAWTPEGGIWMPKNIKSVENSGLEGQGNLIWNKGKWKRQITLGYVYTRSKISEDVDFPEFNGKQQMYVPEHKGHATVYLEYNRVYVRYNQSLTGMVYIDSENEFYLPGSSPANIEIGKIFILDKTSAVLSFRMNNLYNEEYQYVAHMPMPLQNYTINFIYHIN